MDQQRRQPLPPPKLAVSRSLLQPHDSTSQRPFRHPAVPQKTDATVTRMPIKFKAKSKDEIPAELQSLYVERDGAFEVDVDGMVDKTKHDEFRSRPATATVGIAWTLRRNSPAVRSADILVDILVRSNDRPPNAPEHFVDWSCRGTLLRTRMSALRVVAVFRPLFPSLFSPFPPVQNSCGFLFIRGCSPQLWFEPDQKRFSFPAARAA